MDIYGILETDPHKNVCGFETLVQKKLFQAECGGWIAETFYCAKQCENYSTS